MKKNPLLLASILFAWSLSATPLHAKDLHYLNPGEPDAIALLAPPPAANSAEQAADLTEVESVAHSAPPADVAAAKAEHKLTVFAFTPVIGDFFQPGKLPETEKFLAAVQKDADLTAETAKEHWKRPRPYKFDPSLAAGKLEKSFSYPSAHSTESMTVALVLTELFPEKKDAIMAEARAIGWHRVEIGRHYPTDIYAGRVLAQAVVRQMKQNPVFQRDLSAAKAELAATHPTARN